MLGVCFSRCLNPCRFFQSEVLRVYFPALESWVFLVCLAPQLFSHFTHVQMWGGFFSLSPPAVALPGPLVAALLRVLSTWLPSLPLLPVWMNVSSLTLWLLDFHTVQFSVSPGCFLFLNLLLSFFWLCEEAKYIYLLFHMGWKSTLLCSPTFLTRD